MTVEPDDLDDFERMLRDAPLREPSAELDARVTRLCQPRAWRPAWAAVAAAFVVAGGAWAALHRHAQPPAPGVQVVKSTPPSPARPVVAAVADAHPVSIMQTFGGVRNEGIVGTTPDGDPLRRIRRQTLRQVVVIDPRSGKHLTVTVPHEDVYLVRIRAF